MRGATGNQLGALRMRQVSIHAPVRGATRAAFGIRHNYHSFNPRARAGRDLSSRAIKWMKKLFQSTRPCGARRKLEAVVAMLQEFQSTRPCGARRGELVRDIATIQVSIHAPVRGATKTSLCAG